LIIAVTCIVSQECSKYIPTKCSLLFTERSSVSQQNILTLFYWHLWVFPPVSGTVKQYVMTKWECSVAIANCDLHMPLVHRAYSLYAVKLLICIVIQQRLASWNVADHNCWCRYIKVLYSQSNSLNTLIFSWPLLVSFLRYRYEILEGYSLQGHSVLRCIVLVYVRMVTQLTRDVLRISKLRCQNIRWSDIHTLCDGQCMLRTKQTKFWMIQ